MTWASCSAHTAPSRRREVVTARPTGAATSHRSGAGCGPARELSSDHPSTDDATGARWHPHGRVGISLEHLSELRCWRKGTSNTSILPNALFISLAPLGQKEGLFLTNALSPF
ncbi:hypothetical protein E5F05_02980 (plasmid) [Deinococcus metallilatus]|uniref:Uncharacterized protein n=1 Tax=Deinococcus metallilatus TaxID=1211322 RepID=A0AAJ5FAN1_9DEIO|nr:hypothetical protein E5F05_02980 [Deinococcus metallilatus]TLK32377.1 hypothetical protein FCS05_02315 [Deinococcus metallilatus]